jgi:hypothetical protein
MTDYNLVFKCVMCQLGEQWFHKMVTLDDYYAWYNYEDWGTLPGRSLGNFYE